MDILNKNQGWLRWVQRGDTRCAHSFEPPREDGSNEGCTMMYAFIGRWKLLKDEISISWACLCNICMFQYLVY